MFFIYVGLAVVWLGGFCTGLLVGLAQQRPAELARERTKVQDLYPRRGPPDDAA